MKFFLYLAFYTAICSLLIATGLDYKLFGNLVFSDLSDLIAKDSHSKLSYLEQVKTIYSLFPAEWLSTFGMFIVKNKFGFFGIKVLSLILKYLIFIFLFICFSRHQRNIFLSGLLTILSLTYLLKADFNTSLFYSLYLATLLLVFTSPQKSAESPFITMLKFILLGVLFINLNFWNFFIGLFFLIYFRGELYAKLSSSRLKFMCLPILLFFIILFTPENGVALFNSFTGFKGLLLRNIEALEATRLGFKNFEIWSAIILLVLYAVVIKEVMYKDFKLNRVFIGLFETNFIIFLPFLFIGLFNPSIIPVISIVIAFEIVTLIANRREILEDQEVSQVAGSLLQKGGRTLPSGIASGVSKEEADFYFGDDTRINDDSIHGESAGIDLKEVTKAKSKPGLLEALEILDEYLSKVFSVSKLGFVFFFSAVIIVRVKSVLVAPSFVDNLDVRSGDIESSKKILPDFKVPADQSAAD